MFPQGIPNNKYLQNGRLCEPGQIQIIQVHINLAKMIFFHIDKYKVKIIIIRGGVSVIAKSWSIC